MDYYFSKRISGLQPSAIREILKATQDPAIIPFAAGNPDAASFPIEEVKRISAEIFETAPITALQYGVTEGYRPLIDRLTTFVKERYNIGKDFVLERTALFIKHHKTASVTALSGKLCNKLVRQVVIEVVRGKGGIRSIVNDYFIKPSHSVSSNLVCA